VIRLDSPSISIRYQINKAPFDALYNPVMGVNIISAPFAHNLLKHMPLTPIIKLLKGLSGHILSSLGILYVLPVTPQVFSSLIALHLHKHKQASFISCISLICYISCEVKVSKVQNISTLCAISFVRHVNHFSVTY
jgi:hypothetical protein